ncbi:MAG: hypothetical protein ACXW00_11505 [Methylobacter sp.]
MDTNIWQFLCGCVSGDDLKHPFFAVESIKSVEAGKANSLFCVYHKHQWYSYEKTPEWTAIAMTAIQSSCDFHWIVMAMSQTGRIWELHTRDKIESFSQIPNQLAMTNLTTIANTAYACGMGRVLMRRNENGHWSDISAPWPKSSEGIIGFTCVSGLENSLIYAVGWQGEIWTLLGQLWTKEDSPTNANLNAVAVTTDGIVYVVGDNGAMLKGRQNCWELLNTETDLNLTDVCVHMNDVYVCSDFDVYRLTDSGLVHDFNLEGEDVPQTCLKLFSAGSQGLYSMGPLDVFQLINDTWYQLA